MAIGSNAAGVAAVRQTIALRIVLMLEHVEYEMKEAAN
jgi:hypothetical protein